MTPLEKVLLLARCSLGGKMESSARLCLADAIQARDNGNWPLATGLAIRSLCYSVGICHPDYALAFRLAYGNRPVSASPPTF